MSPYIAAALIGGAVTIASAVLAYFGSRHIPRAQREKLKVDTVNAVIEMQDTANQALIKRVVELESEVHTLKIKYADGERALAQARGENLQLAAEVGNLRATLAAREAELAATRLALAASTPPAMVPAGGEST